MADLRPMPQPATEQRHRAPAADRQWLSVAPRGHSVAIARHTSQTVEEGEIGLLLRQGRYEVAECSDNGLPDAPPVTVTDTEQHGIANQRPILRLVATEPEHGFGEDETDIVLQPLAQPVAPVIIAIGVARPAADPNGSVIPHFDRRGRDIVGPDIEGPAAGQ